jgi:AraC-like DNA-binding protein
VLSATSMRAFGGGSIGTTVFLERRFRTHLVTRDRLLFDTAYCPPGKRSGDLVHLYATLRGTMAVAGGPAISGRQAYVLREAEFDRVEPTSRTFRSYGAPCTIVEMRLQSSDLHRPAGLEHGAVELPERVWDAYAGLESEQTVEALHRLIVELGEARIVSRELPGSVETTEPERFERVWAVIKPLYEDLATSTSLKQLAVLARLSLRQLGRDLGEMTRTFGLYGGGFRDAMRVLRLRAACLMLSAPVGTPSEVAKAVGYGSLDAMGRAFRDASLPAPSVVQEAVRYRD